MATWLIPHLGNPEQYTEASTGSASPDTEYEPVYGLSRRAVREWLARIRTSKKRMRRH